MISNHLGKLGPDGSVQHLFPETFSVQFSRAQDLRYGENPHQMAAFYRESDPCLSAVSNARQLQGKELSYNNIMDSDAAWQAVSDFEKPAVIIMKHANPCGAATTTAIWRRPTGRPWPRTLSRPSAGSSP